MRTTPAGPPVAEGALAHLFCALGLALALILGRAPDPRATGATVVAAGADDVVGASTRVPVQEGVDSGSSVSPTADAPPADDPPLSRDGGERPAGFGTPAARLLELDHWHPPRRAAVTS